MIELYEWQKPHVSKLEEALRTGGIAFDGSDTGVGKMYCACEVARRGGGNVFIVCPKAVIPPWERTLRGFGVHPVGIINYEKLKMGNTPFGKFERKNWKWDLPEGTLIIWDEGRRCKSQSSQNARMLRDSKGFPLLILSATLAESPLDLRAAFHVANICDWPKFYPYVLRHGCRKGRFGGLELIQSKREETLGWLHHEIFQKRGSRIRIKDLGDLFPETQITAEAFDLGAAGDIQAIYDEMEEELLALSDAAKYDPESNPLVIQIRARQKTELLKVPGVAALTNDFIEEGNSVVIFTNFKDSLEALHERLGKVGGVVYGGQSAKERQDFIDRFQANEIPYMIVNIQAGGEGISLHDVLGTRPRVSLLFPTFNASDLRQALGRVHRAGGKSKSLQRILFAADTIEEKVCKRVQAKLNNIDMINDGDLAINLNDTPVPVSDIEQGLINSLQMASTKTTILDTKPEAAPLPEPPRAHSEHSPSSLLYKAACCGWMSDKSPDRDTSAADRGTLGHKMIEERDFTLAPDDEALTSAAKKCANFLDGQIARLKRNSDLEVFIHQEIQVQVLNQFGHIDHLYIQGSLGTMTDFKFANSNVYTADSPQFWAYGIGVFHMFPEIENLRVQVLLPFRDEIDVVIWNRAKDLERLVGQVALIIRNAQNPDPAAYRIGKHCTYCERLRTGECSKFVQLGEFLSAKYAEDVEKYVIGDIPTAHGSLVKDPAVMARLYRLAGLMEKAAEGWKKAALAMRLEGTDIPGFDLAERKGRREISSAEAAYEAIKDRVSAEDLVKVSKIGIGAVEGLWKDSFPRGEKGNSVKQLMERLIDADAISSGAPVQYLAEVKK